MYRGVAVTGRENRRLEKEIPSKDKAEHQDHVGTGQSRQSLPSFLLPPWRQDSANKDSNHCPSLITTNPPNTAQLWDIYV